MPTFRTVSCAWCGDDLRIAAPDVGPGGYFVQTRQCKGCAGNNLIELRGADATVGKMRRGRRGTGTTQKIQRLV